MRRLKLEKQPILVTMGGSKFGKKIIDELLNIAKDFDEEFIVFGYIGKERKVKNVQLLNFKNNYLEYLKVCRGVVVLCGHNSLMESLVYKKPALVFPIKNFIEHYLNGYEYSEYIVWKELKNEDFLKVHLKNFFNVIPKLQKKLDGINITENGAEQIVDEIVKYDN